MGLTVYIAPCPSGAETLLEHFQNEIALAALHSSGPCAVPSEYAIGGQVSAGHPPSRHGPLCNPLCYKDS